MCGIFGYLKPAGLGPVDQERATAERCARSLAHRGPDGHGVWLDREGGVVLAHRRLAIIDLSPLGAQPMQSVDGRFSITFNGEIYNFQALRHELEQSGWTFKSRSDTEVLLAAVAAWGVEEACRRAVGMFAFALWDQTRRELILARDHFGQKPLYFGWSGGAFLFASEMKAIRAYPGFQAALNTAAIAGYLRSGNVPAPLSIDQGFHKLQPGHVATLSAQSTQPGNLPGISAYWSPEDIALAGLADPMEGDEDARIDQIENALVQAVCDCSLSDVPLGAFLSGGIDSSLTVALMQKAGSRPVRTFSIGFWEKKLDEAPYAAAVAAHLGTEHTEIRISESDALALIPELTAIYDEPLADSSQIPTCLVSRGARQHVTVALTGDGGDEVFAGYTRYHWGRSIAGAMGRYPRALRHCGAGLARSIPAASWNCLAEHLPLNLPELFGDKLHKLANTIDAPDFPTAYDRMNAFWPDPASAMLAGGAEGRVDRGKLPMAADPLAWMMMRDTLDYLPNDILAKVDRAGMAYSLESRTPFLDWRLFQAAWRIPVDQRAPQSKGKAVLRKILARHLPESLFERPKAGFAVPLAAWLRGGLRPWAEELLSAERLRRDGIFNADAVQRVWQEHLSGNRNWQHRIWTIVMFQAWLDAHRGVSA